MPFAYALHQEPLRKVLQPEELVLKRSFEWRAAALAGGRLLLYGWLVILMAIASLPSFAAAQQAREVKPDEVPPLQRVELESDPAATDGETAHDVFAALAVAWRNEDHDALAELVAADGVEIAITPDRERDTHYSPDQAFYFFKNLFKSSDTDTFQYLRQQNQNEGGLVHAVVDWSYHRPGGEKVIGERLVVKLTHDADGWGLSEIRAIR